MNIIQLMTFINSEWFRRFIASSNRTTCPPHNFAREVNKSYVAVSTYPNIVNKVKVDWFLVGL
jgi:hypothetical protein